MCITTTFVYDCGHKHLIRLHCARNNPLLCSDLNNRSERRYYDCCCCIEYQLGVAEAERVEGEMMMRDGKGERVCDREGAVMGWLEGVNMGEDGGEGYDYDRVEDVAEREGETGEHSDNNTYWKATDERACVEREDYGYIHEEGVGQGDRDQEVDEDGDVDMITGEAFDFKAPCPRVGTEKKEEQKQTESINVGPEAETQVEDDGELLEGMPGGPF